MAFHLCGGVVLWCYGCMHCVWCGGAWVAMCERATRGYASAALCFYFSPRNTAFVGSAGYEGGSLWNLGRAFLFDLP